MSIVDGTSEFLESWLLLIEKMVNVKAVLESTHALPTHSTTPGFVKFDPVEFLAETQKVKNEFRCLLPKFFVALQ